MRVGDLVRVKPQGGVTLASDYWIGVITDFQIRIGDSFHGSRDCRYALVFWSEQYPCEEEYLDQLEVINA